MPIRPVEKIKTRIYWKYSRPRVTSMAAKTVKSNFSKQNDNNCNSQISIECGNKLKDGEGIFGCSEIVGGLTSVE